jgi:predicted site-specific integrase-resolvase
MQPYVDSRGYLTKKEAAAVGRVSVKTVSRWLQMGLPYIQVTANGRILIKDEDLEQFLNSKRVQRGALLDDLVTQTMKEMDI